LSRVEQKYRRRKREREREKWNETRERRQRRARHSSVRLCVSVRHSGYWLLLKAHLAILALALLLHEPSFPLQSRHLISGTSRMISKPEPDTKPPPTPFLFCFLFPFLIRREKKKGIIIIIIMTPKKRSHLYSADTAACAQFGRPENREREPHLSH
jgi:hypothetical protein